MTEEKKICSPRPACLLAMGQKVIRKRLPRYRRGIVRRKHRKTVILSSSYTDPSGTGREGGKGDRVGRTTYDHEYTVRLKEWEAGSGGGLGRARDQDRNFPSLQIL